MNIPSDRRFWIILFVVVLIGVIAAPQTKKRAAKPASTPPATSAPDVTPLAAPVRDPFVAGQFYPADPAELRTMIDRFFAAATPPPVPGTIHALISPHAGFVYSGPVAAFGYKALNRNYRRVIILASNHTEGAPYFRFAVSGASAYRTPLGTVPVAAEAQQLADGALFRVVPAAEASHIIEVQLPFLQQKLQDFEIIPIVTGDPSPADITAAAERLLPLADDQTLFVVSSDLSHYHPYDSAVARDRDCIGHFESIDLEQSARCEACGRDAALILLQIARARGWKAKILDYRNSGDTSGEKDRVVGYSSIAFFDEPMNSSDRHTLLELSRTTLQSYLTSGKAPDLKPEEVDARLRQVQGCFVTLKEDGELRGCIGHILPVEPLYQCIIENSINAAVHDPRFPPVTPAEIPNIKIEVSALSVPVERKQTTEQELLTFLKPLKHGVILTSGSRSATYLPQVWEQLPDRREFLTSLCRKGGMEDSCWKDPKTRVSTYEAEVFGEDEITADHEAR